MHKICGVVVDSQTANPIAGALVVARTLKSTQECEPSAPHLDWADDSGRFAIEVPEGSKWEVQTRTLGVTSNWKPASPGSDVSLDVNLSGSFEIKLFATKERGE